MVCERCRNGDHPRCRGVCACQACAALRTGAPADLHARIAELEAQVAGLEAMNTEKAAEIRRLRMGRHPAGRALVAERRIASANVFDPDGNIIALAEALTERDAEHEGGAGA